MQFTRLSAGVGGSSSARARKARRKKIIEEKRRSRRKRLRLATRNLFGLEKAVDGGSGESSDNTWARGGGKGGGILQYPPPRTSKKVLPPIPTTSVVLLLSTPNWLVAEGGRKNDYFCSKLPKFCHLSAAIKNFFDFVFYSPSFPPQKGGTCSPPGGPKTTLPQTKFG